MVSMVCNRWRGLAGDLRAAMVGRDEEIEGLLAAAIAGEHVLLLGPKGTGKSLLARLFAKAFTGAQYFEVLLTRYSVPEEVFGPLSLKGLKADEFRRITTGKLPEADVAFLDEIFKSNAGLLNSLLTAINERVFHNQGGPSVIPLRTVIGASNEFAEGPELDALFDRFLVRYWVEPTKTAAEFVAMLTGSPAVQSVLTMEDWDTARGEAGRLPLSDDLPELLFRLRKKLTESSVAASDRRWKRAVGLMRASAWLAGDSVVTEDNLGILKHVLWSSLEDREKVATVVSAAGDGVASKITKIGDQVVALLSTASDGMDQAKLVSLNSDGNRALQQLQEIRERASAKNKARAHEQITRVSTALEPVRAIARRMLSL
jgi:MoxR-like ATPase